MECIIGVRFKDFVLLAGDTAAGRSIMVMKQDHDRLMKLEDKIGMLISGDPGDCSYFGEFIQKNVHLYNIRHDYPLSPSSAATWTRNKLAYYLRRSPFHVNTIIGGYDDASKSAKLYFLDYLGSMADVPFAAHGYSAYFVLSIFDRFYKEDMNKEEGVKLLVRCFAELQKRFLVNFPSFTYYFIDKDGFSDRNVIQPEEIKKLAESLKEEELSMEAAS